MGLGIYFCFVFICYNQLRVSSERSDENVWIRRLICIMRYNDGALYQTSVAPWLRYFYATVPLLKTLITAINVFQAINFVNGRLT